VNSAIVKLFIAKEAGHPLFRTVTSLKKLFSHDHAHICYLAVCFAYPELTWSDNDIFMLFENGRMIDNLKLDFSVLERLENDNDSFFEFPKGLAGQEKLTYLKNAFVNFDIEQWKILSDLDQQDLFSAAFAQSPDVVMSVLHQPHPRVSGGYLFTNSLFEKEEKRLKDDVDFSVQNRAYWESMFPESYKLDRFTFKMDEFQTHQYTLVRNEFFVSYGIEESDFARNQILALKCNDLLFKLNRAKGVDSKFLNILKPKIETAVDQAFSKKILKLGKEEFKLGEKYREKEKKSSGWLEKQKSLKQRKRPFVPNEVKKKVKFGLKCDNCGRSNHKSKDCFQPGGPKYKKRAKVAVESDSDS